MRRIVSLLPAATEIVHALGAGAELVGRSHECDFPPGVARLPIVSRPAIALDGAGQSEIDRSVSSRLASGESLYLIDERVLRELDPHIILTQNLCRVCAPSGNELSRAIQSMPASPDILWLTPRTIADIEENILSVGAATGRHREAAALVEAGRTRIARVQDAVHGAPVRRAAFLEWIDPVFCAGHWVPEMIALAGGHDPLGRPGADSQRISWDAVVAADPEIVIVAPCGFGLDGARELARSLPRTGDWEVHAVDANAYFARPGPRVAEGVEVLARVFHPERFD
jgi:iron complex transport system substrate-binding protein